MFSNVALNVFIGLVFVFLLYSLLATIVQEWIAVTIGFRARVLEKAILRMLEDGKTTAKYAIWDRIAGLLHILGLAPNQLKGKTIAPWFYAHPLIKYLGEDNFYSKPASLQAEDFSKVMIDLLKGFGQPESQFVKTLNDSIHQGIIYKLPINLIPEAGETLPDKANRAIEILQQQNKNVQKNDDLALQTVKINRNTSLYLRSLWLEAGADPLVFRKLLERWFDETMKRATGWYKRYTRFILFILGLLLAYWFNVDAIAIHRILSRDPKLSEQLVEVAVNTLPENRKLVQQVKDGTLPQDTGLLRSTYDHILGEVQLSNNILGFGKPWKDSCELCNTNQARYAGMLDERVKLKKMIDTASKRGLSADSISKYQKRNGILARKMWALGPVVKRCNYIKEQVGNKCFKYSPYQAGGWETFFGWMITALAITLGAPFWFDILNKLVSVKNVTGKVLTASGEGTGATTTNNQPVNISVRRESDDDAIG